MINLFGKSLKQETKNKIKKDYPKLIIPIKQLWHEKLTSENSYLYIALGVFLVFGVIFFKTYYSIFSCLNCIYFKDDTAEKILENRIGNVATMISFSLSIATFLITNHEKKNKENREILIQQTNLYPTLYFALIIVFYYIIVSLLKDTIIQHSKVLFENIVIYFHFLILILIRAIVELFKNIIHIFNPNFTDKWLAQQIIFSTKKALYAQITEEVSHFIYENFLQIIKSENFKIDKKARWSSSHKHIIIIPEDKVISDINLSKIKKIIQSKSSIIITPSPYSVHLHKANTLWSSSIFYLSDNNSKIAKRLTNAFTFSKPQSDMVVLKSYQNALKKITIDTIKKDNNDEFLSLFSNYQNIFKTYFDIIDKSSHISIENKQGYDVINSLKWDIQDLLYETIQRHKPDLFAKIVDCITDNIEQAFKMRQLNPFIDYLKIFESIYPKVFYSNSCELKLVGIGEWLKSGLKDIHQILDLTFEKAAIEEKEQINLFYYHFYNAAAQTLYQLLSFFQILNGTGT